MRKNELKAALLEELEYLEPESDDGYSIGRSVIECSKVFALIDQLDEPVLSGDCLGSVDESRLLKSIRAVVDNWVVPVLPRSRAASEFLDAVRPYLTPKPVEPEAVRVEVSEDEALAIMAKGICGVWWDDENIDQSYHRNTARSAFRALTAAGYTITKKETR